MPTSPFDPNTPSAHVGESMHMLTTMPVPVHVLWEIAG
jgi:hypothetical protein